MAKFPSSLRAHGPYNNGMSRSPGRQAARRGLPPLLAGEEHPVDGSLGMFREDISN